MYIDLRKLALNIFVSISTLGNIHQIKVLLDTDLIPLLCGQLHSPDNCTDIIIEVSFLRLCFVSSGFWMVINLYLHKFNSI